MQTATVVALPSDPENMNDRRAELADSILVAFARQQEDEETAAISEFSITTNPDVDLQTLSDLLCQFGHWCDRNGFQLAEALKIAATQYSDETEAQGRQFIS
jgi:hypothetical protein